MKTFKEYINESSELDTIKDTIGDILEKLPEESKDGNFTLAAANVFENKGKIFINVNLDINHSKREDTQELDDENHAYKKIITKALEKEFGKKVVIKVQGAWNGSYTHDNSTWVA